MLIKLTLGLTTIGPFNIKRAFLTFGPTMFPACGERKKHSEEGETFFELSEEAAMSGFSSLISYRNGAISLLRLSFSKFGCFSRVGISCGAVKHSKRDAYGEFVYQRFFNSFFHDELYCFHNLIAFPHLL